MTLYPPLWAQNVPYPALGDRQLVSAAFQPGVIDVNALRVGPRAQGAAMSVEVQGGICVLPGPSGNYVCVSDGLESRDVAPAPVGANRRFDLVIAQLYDPQATGIDSGDAFWDIEVITGTASTAPAVPDVPDYAIPLAVLNMTSGLVSVTAATIIERRPAADRGSRGVLGRTVRTSLWTVGTAALAPFMWATFTVLGHRYVRCYCEAASIGSANAGNATDAYVQIDGNSVGTSHMRHRVDVVGGGGYENRACDGIAVLDPGVYSGSCATRMSPSGQTIWNPPIELVFTDLGEAPANVAPDIVPAPLVGVVPRAASYMVPEVEDA